MHTNIFKLLCEASCQCSLSKDESGKFRLEKAHICCTGIHCGPESRTSRTGCSSKSSEPAQRMLQGIRAIWTRHRQNSTSRHDLQVLDSRRLSQKLPSSILYCKKTVLQRDWKVETSKVAFEFFCKRSAWLRMR